MGILIKNQKVYEATASKKNNLLKVIVKEVF